MIISNIFLYTKTFKSQIEWWSHHFFVGARTPAYQTDFLMMISTRCGNTDSTIAKFSCELVSKLDWLFEKPKLLQQNLIKIRTKFCVYKIYAENIVYNWPVLIFPNTILFFPGKYVCRCKWTRYYHHKYITCTTLKMDLCD